MTTRLTTPGAVTGIAQRSTRRGAAAARHLLHRDKDVLGAGGEIHRAADAAALLPGHLPIGEIAVLGDLVGAEHGDVDAAAADHAERVGVMTIAAPGLQRHVLAAGVDEVQILLARPRSSGP